MPYLSELILDEEDSLGLSQTRSVAWEWSGSPDRPLRVAVVALPSFSNFTDFDALSSEPSVSLCYVRTPEQLRFADIVILPGSKQTVDDLFWLRACGLADACLDHARQGLVVGICGGMQMLGETISDPSGIEHQGVVNGLGLLPIRTTMHPDKVTDLATGAVTATRLFGQDIPPLLVSGYEIHVGATTYLDRAAPFAALQRNATSELLHDDGCVAADGRIIGTYVHGLFDADDFRHALIGAARSFYGVQPAVHVNSWPAMREAALTRLAAAVEQALDMKLVFSWVGCTYKDAETSGAAQ